MKFRQWVPLWTIPLVVLLAIGTVWLRLAIVRTTYSINQANREIRNLQLDKEQMELKTAALRSPRRLELLARTRFGLSQPQSDRIIHLKSARVATALASAERKDPLAHVP